MRVVQSIRRWWQVRAGRQETPLDGDAPFWFFSLAFHVVLLIALAITLVDHHQRTYITVLVSPPQPSTLLDVPLVQFDFDPAAALGANSDSGLVESLATAPNLAQTVEVAYDLDANLHDFGDVPMHEFQVDAVSTRVETLPVRGAVGVATAGAQGAVDRITQEILLSLEERPTLVVWLFDQSPSMMAQREEVIARFDRIYDELKMIQVGGGRQFQRHSVEPLLTDIVAFGQSYRFMLQQPTAQLEEIRNAARSITLDQSGIENVFTAVSAAVDRHKSLRRILRRTGDRERNVMVVVLTDEAGDDIEHLETAVRLCRQYQVPVYVIGAPAPFGRQQALIKWVDPDPNFDQSVQWAPLDMGPESLMPERLRLTFIGINEGEEELLDSGFGPFGLTRLCFESGGIFFTVHPNRRTGREVTRRETVMYAPHFSRFFDPQVMRRYRPDYVSAEAYMKGLQANKSRQALVQAAQQSWLSPMQAPALEFRRFDEAQFNNAVTIAQRAAAVLEPRINQLYDILRMGEDDRSLESVPRWQAGYDLAMGRVLATKVRAETYNAMLAMAKTSLKFQNERNNTWILTPADEVTTGSQAARLAERAKMYLQRVIDEHRDTPWAYLAAKELSTPIGWQWRETFRQPPPPPDMRVANNPPPNPNPNPEPPPPPRRPPPRL